MKAKEFDEKFDAGADVTRDIDWSKARRRDGLTFKLGFSFQRLALHGGERGQEHRRKQRDDRDDDKQFYKRKAGTETAVQE